MQPEEGRFFHADAFPQEGLAFLLMQSAADDFQDALFREIEEPAGQRGDADIDVTRNGGGGDRLRGLEEPKRQFDSLIPEIPPFLSHIKRRGRQRSQHAKPHDVGRVRMGQWGTDGQRRDERSPRETLCQSARPPLSDAIPVAPRMVSGNVAARYRQRIMPPPLLTLQDIHLTFGTTPLLSGASLSVSAGDRVCLVGRNGSGKSTLLRIAGGLMPSDSGRRFAQPGATIRYLPQEPDFSEFATTLAYVEAGFDEGAAGDRHRASHLLEQLGLNGTENPSPSSDLQWMQDHLQLPGKLL